MDATDAPAWLSTGDISMPVRRLLGDGASVRAWTSQQLTAGSSDALGVWRVSGDATTGDRVLSWSLVLKGWRAPEAGVSPSSMSWPRREAVLYHSGLLDDLPGGIAAPACFGHDERADGSTWLWTEDVQDSASGPWPLDRFASHARLLGQMNGSWLAGRPLPEVAGLSHGWIRERVETARPFIEQLSSIADHPLVRRVYSPAVAAAWMRIWAARQAYLAELDRLPQTFCHLDAFPRNAFTRRASDGSDQTVLIDWAFSGIGALGEELASPIVASVMFKEAPVDEARHLEALAIDGYLDGLRDAGWHGNPDDVRRGYAIAAALRYGVGGMGRWVPVLLDESIHSIAERVFGHPFEEAVTISVAVQRWLAGLVPDS